MVRGDVELNSVGYFLKPYDDGEHFRREKIRAFGQVALPDGRQQQESLVNYTSRLFARSEGGLGLDHMPSDLANDPEAYKRFWDADIDTRWGCCKWLPILEESSSTDVAMEVVRASAAFKGDIWTIWEDDTSSDILARKYNGGSTEWEAGGSVITTASSTVVGQDLVAHKTHLVCLFAQLQQHTIYRSTDGSSWSASSTGLGSNLLADNVTANEDIDAGLLVTVGSDLIAVIWDEDSGTITFFQSTDAGDNWTDSTVDIASGNGPQGVAAYPGTDGVTKLYVGTREGLYEVDVSDSTPSNWTFDLVYTMTSDNNNCRRMTVHNGELWFAQGVADDVAPPVVSMSTQGGVRVFNSKRGLDRDAGVPSSTSGPMTWMKSSGLFLYAAVGGSTTGKNAKILCHNGQGWHHMTENSTADELIDWLDTSSEDDGTPRLHYAKRTGASTSTTHFLGQFETNPHSGATIKRESAGSLDLPEIDGGMPTTSAVWLQVRVAATDLSADTTGEYISVSHGLEGAARSTTSLGNIVSGTNKLDYASGAGEGGVSDALRLTLNRDGGDNTQSPILRSVEMDYIKVPDLTSRWTFVVDIAKTAQETNLPVATVMSNLRSAQTNNVLVTFAYPGLTQTNVEVDILFRETPMSAGIPATMAVPNSQAELFGFAEVVAEEKIN